MTKLILIQLFSTMVMILIRANQDFNEISVTFLATRPTIKQAEKLHIHTTDMEFSVTNLFYLHLSD